MTAPSNTDDVVEQILSTYDAITVVGASANPSKAANEVPAYMKNRGWRIIPVNPAADEIVGEKVYRTLADIPEQVGLVDVFRPGPECADVARAAVAAARPRSGCSSGSSRRRRGRSPRMRVCCTSRTAA